MRVPRLLPATLLTLAAAPAPLAAQTRPLLTEPALTAPAGRLVLETGFDAIADEPSFQTGVEREAWSGPLLRLVCSPAENVELDVEWTVRVGVWNDALRFGAQSSDFGDVALRAKWRFARGGGRRPTLAARFGVYLPETSYEDKQFRPLGLGPNTLRAFVEGLLTLRLGRGLLHANAGLFLADEVFKTHDQRDFLSYGIALEWPLRERLAAVAEVAGRAGEGRPGADAHSEGRVGLRLSRGRLAWDAALRRGLTKWDGTWGATVGLAWTLRPGR
jgi:hypothetical protein